ncbi:MAG: CBS domain-containing protein [Minicystis sp.]
MTSFATPISAFMTSPVMSIPETASLAAAHQLLRDRSVSCLAVTRDDRPAGVISRTDLLRAGRFAARARDGGSASRAPLLTFPDDKKVGDVMRRDIIALPPEATVSAAARTLMEHRIHRVFVRDGDRLRGVFSTKDLLLAIREKRIGAPIAEAMSTPVFTVPVGATLALATDRLDKAHISGLCVVDEDAFPVGTFTQTEAMTARDLPADTPVEEVMSYAMLCVDVRTPLFRAAGYAHATRARRVLAVEGRRLAGVVTGLDFARVAAAG